MNDFKNLQEAIEGKTAGEWNYTTCYGVATIEDKDKNAIAHAVEYLKTTDADFIALMGTVAPEIMTVIRAANIVVSEASNKAFFSGAEWDLKTTLDSLQKAQETNKTLRKTDIETGTEFKTLTELWKEAGQKPFNAESRLDLKFRCILIGPDSMAMGWDEDGITCTNNACLKQWVFNKEKKLVPHWPAIWKGLGGYSCQSGALYPNEEEAKKDIGSATFVRLATDLQPIMLEVVK